MAARENDKGMVVLEKYYRSYMKINLSAISHNLAECRKKTGDAKLLVVVKADGYGHGAVEIARHVEKQADYFAVACLSEAIWLRESGIRKPILILGYISPKEYGELLSYHITPTIYSYEEARKLSDIAQMLQTTAVIHIAIDTGMGRIGYLPEREAVGEIVKISELPGIALEGLFTHFAKADESDPTYTYEQIAKFTQFADWLKEAGVEISLCHCCNSAGIVEFSEYRMDMVRAGIVTYGLWPSEEVNQEEMQLIPAMEWKAHIVHVKELPAGHGISYGGTYITPKPMKIATVSVGYADGYPRALSGVGEVLVRGQRAKIIGRICMDQMMIDVTHIPEIYVEDIVTLVGSDGAERIHVEELSELSGRFNYEFVCDISTRVSRIYEE